MNGSHGDTRRVRIGSNAVNPGCLGGYRSNGNLSESSEFLHITHSLKSATSSSGKVLLSSGISNNNISGVFLLLASMSAETIDQRFADRGLNVSGPPKER
ncbi:hypothetical protein TNCV_1503621 [Trichonephila clavipes]|uniref:Uncharacterized protein n=1 Tax=Trichonephila clavipes TaxID=2585209 RepID=A0A8X6RNJ5_TRICX|nr:hypothetical protein TNCV_1503621 [Trichonephila clavipes]